MSTAFYRLAIAFGISCLVPVTFNAQCRSRRRHLPQLARRGHDPSLGPCARTCRAGSHPPDFEVRDNGRLRPIIEFRSDRQSPVTLAILVDISGSMGMNPRSPWPARHTNRCCLSCCRVTRRPLCSRSARRFRSGVALQDLSRLQDGWRTSTLWRHIPYDATAAAARRWRTGPRHIARWWC